MSNLASPYGQGYEGQQGYDYGQEYDGYDQQGYGYEQEGYEQQQQQSWQQQPGSGWSGQQQNWTSGNWTQPAASTSSAGGPLRTYEDIKALMKERKEYYSTLGSILLSMTDFVLHLSCAWWLTHHYWGLHQPFWSFIVLALVANLIGIVLWILKASVPEGGPGGAPSEFSRKLVEAPNECVFILCAAIVNTECLCFLSESEAAHRHFRILDILRTFFEDVPIFFLQFSFIISHGFIVDGNALMLISFFVTCTAVSLKAMRALILWMVGTPDVEPKKQFFSNARVDDWILTPIYTMHFLLCFILIIAFQRFAYSKRFAHEWLSAQFFALGGFNASDAIYMTVANSTYHNVNPATLVPLLEELTIMANTAQNDTHIFGNCTAPSPPMAPPPPSPFNPGAWTNASLDPGSGEGSADPDLFEQGAYLCALTIETIVARVLLPSGYTTDESVRLADTYLSADAVALVHEWKSLHKRLRQCFGVGLFFFVGGMAASVGMLMRYLKKALRGLNKAAVQKDGQFPPTAEEQKYSEAFITRLMWRSSMTSAFVAAASMINGGALNALTQTRFGYSIVKRDSAICHILFLGLPMMSVAAAALGGFDCQHRDCSMGYAGSDVQYYTVFTLIVNVPLVWWQFLSFLTASVAVRSASDTSKTDLPTDQKELDALEPPVTDNAASVKNELYAFLASTTKWIVQLFLLLVLFWNSPMAMRTIGGKSVREWLDLDGVLEDSARKLDLPMPLWIEGAEKQIAGEWQKNITLLEELDAEYFRTGASMWVLGMLVNVVVVGLYLAWYSTPAMRRTVEQKLGLTAFAFTLSCVHPEAMRSLADRRTDVMVLRKIGFVPALLLDLPVVILCLRFLLTYGYNGFILAAGLLSLAHCAVYFARAAIVTVTATLRREPLRDQPAFVKFTLGDMITQGASMLQFGLCVSLIGLYYHGWKYGPAVGFEEGEVAASRSSFYAASFVVIAYLCASFGCAISFLNHFEFSHAGISDNSYRSAVVLIASCFDASWLSLIAVEESAVREVKRAAAFVSLGCLFAPMIVLQAILTFMATVPFSRLNEFDDDLREDLVDDADNPAEAGSGYDAIEFDRLIAASSVQNGAFALTVVVGVWKLLLLTILHTTRQNAGITSPFIHTPWVLGEQWKKNRQLPEGFDEAQRRARRALEMRQGRGNPTHHMGYAIDADGNYIYDETGNYQLGEGVNYTYDETGNYVQDEYGNYILQDAEGVVISEGYGVDGYGGFVENDPEPSATAPDNQTSTSRSDSWTNQGGTSAEPSEAGGYAAGQHDPSQPQPAQMWYATCPKKALFPWEGVQGVFVALAHTPEQPYLFVAVHDVQDVKKGGLFSSKKGEEQVKVQYMSLDVGSLDQKFVEANISSDPQTAFNVLMGYPVGEAAADGGYGAGGADAWQQGGGASAGELPAGSCQAYEGHGEGVALGAGHRRQDSGGSGGGRSGRQADLGGSADGRQRAASGSLPRGGSHGDLAASAAAQPDAGGAQRL